jgi:DNA-binding transcriptional MerR regulator
MSYTVNQLAKLAGISVRTLHHYDQMGILEPSRIKNNGYRFYEEKELLKLQQILFFKELDFPLIEINKIINNPYFDMEKALKDQKKLIELKKERLNSLIKTINKTIKKINKKNIMKDEELYDGLDKEKMEEYAKEAKERWGNTDAYKQSQERTKNWTKEDYRKLAEDGDKWMKNFALQMNHGPKSKIVQELIDQHYNSLRTFYEPNLQMYRGLADMYVNDPRFTAYYEKYAKGLSRFMRDAMYEYCDSH